MRRLLLFVIALFCLVLTGCAEPPQQPAYQFVPPKRQLSYLKDVEPILVKRCVVCHSCYNSPCQLKLSSWDGLDRGASKKQIYDASRLKSMDPSRLFIDAHSTEQWREKGFFPVTPKQGSATVEDSMMYMLLEHKRLSPLVQGEYYSEADDLTCAESKGEMQLYLKKHPNNGMPFGFPPLTQDHFNTIVGWLSQGAPGPGMDEQKALKAVSVPDQKMIAKWERFLNNSDPKYRMTARYLYEHLFLAHISFETGSNEFYELVRSRTAPGREIDIIASVRPYDDPGSEHFSYRFRKIYSTIVYKTHMVFPFDDHQYQRINELFIKPEWPQEPHLVDYNAMRSANPFETYEQIPGRSRYQWLLDNSRYVLMTFIRGPVCKGQIALNVINDHFWVAFLDPDYDLSIKYPGFLKLNYEKLRMPNEDGSNYSLFDAILKNKHYKWALEYYRSRQDFYAAHYPDGLGLQQIWKGERATDDPILTVFRHFDSASVHRGVLGNLPKTAWVIDYPLIEQIYYSLVAGFDVYGTTGHQLATRLYMDALRMEGESYFLDFMPEDKRTEIMNSWYIGVKPERIDYYSAPIPAGFTFQTNTPKREFLKEIVENHITVDGIAFDQNYLPAGTPFPPLPKKYKTLEDYMQGFIAVSAPGTSFFRHVKDYNANLAWVRIKNIPGKEDRVVSMVVDRWHDNVKFLFDEGDTLDPSKDKVDFIAGFIGSYPNFFFVVNAEDLPDFFDILDNYDGSPAFIKRLEKYGINRADTQFWETYDWFQAEFYKDMKQYPGLIDLNRYFYYARNMDMSSGQ